MNLSTKLTFLEQFPLFATLSPTEVQQLHQMVELKSKPRHAAIYQHGDNADMVYFLVKGVIKISTHSADEREVIKGLLHPLAMFGELGLAGEVKRQDTAVIMSDEAQFFTLRIADLQRLMSNNPKLTLGVMHLIGKRLIQAEQRLESLVFKDARTRIIDFLKDSTEQFGRRVGYEMLLKHSLTQQDIANMTGTSRQTVTSVLNELRKLDLIYFNRKSILIRDVARLA